MSKQFYFKQFSFPIRCYHSGPQWTWEWWQWRGTLHSPKLQHFWRFTIRLFIVITRTLVEGGGRTPLQRCSRCILQPQPTGQVFVRVCIYIYIYIKWIWILIWIFSFYNIRAVRLTATLELSALTIYINIYMCVCVCVRVCVCVCLPCANLIHKKYFYI